MTVCFNLCLRNPEIGWDVFSQKKSDGDHLIPICNKTKAQEKSRTWKDGIPLSIKILEGISV